MQKHIYYIISNKKANYYKNPKGFHSVFYVNICQGDVDNSCGADVGVAKNSYIMNKQAIAINSNDFLKYSLFHGFFKQMRVIPCAM